MMIELRKHLNVSSRETLSDSCEPRQHSTRVLCTTYIYTGTYSEGWSSWSSSELVLLSAHKELGRIYLPIIFNVSVPSRPQCWPRVPELHSSLAWHYLHHVTPRLASLSVSLWSMARRVSVCPCVYGWGEVHRRRCSYGAVHCFLEWIHIG